MRRQPTAVQGVAGSKPRADEVDRSRTMQSKPRADEADRSRTVQSKPPAPTTIRPRLDVEHSAPQGAPPTGSAREVSRIVKPRPKLPTNTHSHGQDGSQPADHNRGISPQTALQDPRRPTTTSHTHNASLSRLSSPSPPPPDEVLRRHMEKRKAQAQVSSSKVPSPPVQSKAPTAHLEEAIGPQQKPGEPRAEPTQPRQRNGGQSHAGTSNTIEEKSSISQARAQRPREPVTSQSKGPGPNAGATRPQDGVQQSSTADPGAPREALQTITVASKSTNSKARAEAATSLRVTRIPPPLLPNPDHTTVCSFSCAHITY